MNLQAPALSPLFQPQLKAMVYEKGEIRFSVIGTGDFHALLNETDGKGFWMLYSPSPEQDRNPVGHLSVSVNDTYFTGQWAMQSLKGVNARLDNHPYVVAQFLELSDSANQALYKFMHDKVWYHHQGHPDYTGKYAVLPFSKDAQVPNGENCVTSNLAFLEDKWISKRPELLQIRDELQGISVSEVPSRQIWLNTQSPAYRGTVIITHKPEEATQWMTEGEFNASHTGKQLLFDGRPQRNF